MAGTHARTVHDGREPEVFRMRGLKLVTTGAGPALARNVVIVPILMFTGCGSGVDAEGRFIRVAGGMGGGPGEFGMAATMARLEGDTIAVWDMRRMSLNLFTADGRFAGLQQSFLPAAFPEVRWSRALCAALPILPGGGFSAASNRRAAIR
jgi:hypothetical protein